MKKLFALLLCVSMLMGCLIIGTSAATDLEFSMKGASGKPDDTVTVDVNLDKNTGTWCAKVEIIYDNRYLSLISVDNGDVYKNSEYTTSALTAEKNGKGCFTYYGELNDPDGVNTNTGRFFSLNFQILKTAPNGNYEIKLEFPDNGDGWFFTSSVDSAGNLQFTNKTVSCTNKAYVAVSGSDATEPVTDPSDSLEVTTAEGQTTKAPDTAYVTDEGGKLIQNEDGSYETYVITNKNEVPPKYVFDEDGNPVTDDAGAPVTEEPDETTEPNTEAESIEQANKEAKRLKIGQIAIIGCVLIAAAAAVVIIIVVTKNYKKKDDTDGKGE